jgi:hypothetical protein
MVRKRFRAWLEPTSGGGAVCKLSFDVKAIFGKARAPIRVKINGYEFRTTVAVYGGQYLLGISKEHREAARISLGEPFMVTLELDTEPRTVTVPPELATALAEDSAAQAAWDALSYSHQREHVQEIDGAKTAATRERRVARTLSMLVPPPRSPTGAKRRQRASGQTEKEPAPRRRAASSRRRGDGAA